MLQRLSKLHQYFFQGLDLPGCLRSKSSTLIAYPICIVSTLVLTLSDTATVYSQSLTFHLSHTEEIHTLESQKDPEQNMLQEAGRSNPCDPPELRLPGVISAPVFHFILGKVKNQKDLYYLKRIYKPERTNRYYLAKDSLTANEIRSAISILTPILSASSCDRSRCQ